MSQPAVRRPVGTLTRDAVALLLATLLGVASCAGEPASDSTSQDGFRYAYDDSDVEIAQAAAIGGATAGAFFGAAGRLDGNDVGGVVRLYDVEDLARATPAFPGEEVNLDPTGEAVPVRGGRGGSGGRAALEREWREVAESLSERQSTGQAADYTFPDTWSGLLARRQTAGKKTSAPVTTWKRAQAVPNASTLFVGDKETLPLEGVQATVRIDGFRARVVLDCFYRNDRDRQLEGTFKLRLPDEATPYFFAFGETRVEGHVAAANTVEAMFVPPEQSAALSNAPAEIMEIRERRWSEPREARIVLREKAAHAYGETVRRRIDPALMEWAGAGVFSSRVFPLAPGKLHRIVIGYDVNLLPAGEDLEYRLDVPQGAGQLDVTLDVERAARATVSPGTTLPAGDAAGRRQIHHFRNPEAQTITARIPRPGATMIRGEDLETGAYFAARFRPELPTVAAQTAPRAVFLVDTSLNSNPERYGTWLELLRATLDNNRDTMREFAVLFFNVESFWWRETFTTNTPAAVDEMVAFADRLALEGATDLGAALGAAAAPPAALRARHDLFLLSDGAPTWGENALGPLAERLRNGPTEALFAYKTGFAGTDTRTLEHLTRETGGAVFSVVGSAEVAAASVAHRSRPWHIRRITVPGGSDLLLAGRPTSVFPGQDLLLVGRGAPQSGASVTLSLEQGGQTRDVAVRMSRVVGSALAPRAYGVVAVGQIEDLAAEAEDAARAYATHFRVVGKTCSLLMLETEEDYERYGVVPEEDAGVVERRPAGPIVEERIAARRREANDARSATLAWLRRLQEIPGGSFELPASLEQAMTAMPVAAFDVRTTPLRCRERLWKDVPGAVQEQLVSRRLDYDAISREGARRKDALGAADALRALSSLVENAPGDTALARDVGYSALAWGLPDHAYHLFRRVAHARPYEPQSYRAMARSLEAQGKHDLALVYYEVAVGGNWSGNYGAFKTIAGMDYLRLLRRIQSGAARASARDYAASRLASFEQELAVGNPDLVVAITWNTDRTDIDLHVTDPSGEECYYQHQRTKMGGSITTDVTGGYGPEMFLLPRAAPGEYRVRVKYYGTDRNRASLRTKVQCTIFRDWGTPREQMTERVVPLSKASEMYDVMRVRIGR